MATLNSNNIVNGNTIQTADILQLYNALNFSAAPETFLVSISGSLLGTSSFATTAVTAQTASFVTTAQTASFVTTAQTASFVTTAQTASFVTTAQTASFVTTAQTASVALTAQTASFVIPVNNSSGAINYSLALVSGSIPQSLAFDTDVIYNPTANQLTVTNLSSSAIITTSITGSTIFASSSFQTSGSRVRRYRTITLSNGDYSLSPSPSIQSDDDIVLIIDNTTGASSPGEGNLSITNFLNSLAGRCVEIVKVKDGTGGGIIILNAAMSGNTLNLNNENQVDGIRVICSSSGNSITLMSMGASSTGSAWGNGY